MFAYCIPGARREELEEASQLIISNKRIPSCTVPGIQKPPVKHFYWHTKIGICQKFKVITVWGQLIFMNVMEI